MCPNNNGGCDSQRTSERTSSNNDEPPIISQDFLGISGRWSGPFDAACRLLDADRANRWKSIVPLAGIFHYFMQSLKQANMLNEEDVSFLVSQCIGKSDSDATERNTSSFTADTIVPLSFDLTSDDPAKVESALMYLWGMDIESLQAVKAIALHVNLVAAVIDHSQHNDIVYMGLHILHYSLFHCDSLAGRLRACFDRCDAFLQLWSLPRSWDAVLGMPSTP